MSDITPQDAPIRPGKSKLLMALPLVVGLAAFGVSYMGYASPSAMLKGSDTGRVPLPDVAFVDVPRIVVPLAGRERQLMLSAKLETTSASMEQVALFMPRVSDSFTSFLSDIDPAAFDRRGVLEIIRGELRARADMLLGEGAIENLLITEFAIQ